MIGAGAGRKVAGVRWSLAGTMLAGWLITLPAAACLAGAAAFVAVHVGGVVGAGIVAIALGLIALAIFVASLRNRVTAANVNDEVAAGQVLAMQPTQRPADLPEEVA